MGRWRLLSAAMLVGAACVGGAPAAQAQTSVLPSPADTSDLREVQVAYAIGPDRSTLWFGARVYGASDQVIVIVPAAPGAMIDTASDAWFEALRLATHPRVLPPASKPPACASTEPPPDGTYAMIGDANHTPSLAPSDGTAVRSFSELVVWAQGAGFNLSFEQLSTLADLDVSGYRFVTIPFDPAPGETLLRTIRVVSPETKARVPLLLSRTGASATRAFVWVLGEGQATPAGWPWATVPTQQLQWKLDGTSAQTNYADLWSAYLDQHNDQAWVLEAAAQGLLLSTTSFASGKASIPSVASTFFSRAAGYGEGDPDFAPCVMHAEALDAALSKVGEACATGALAVVPGAADAGACSEQAGAGEIDPAELRCGSGASDLALALSGMTPSKVWVTRWTGRIGAWQSRAVEPFVIGPGTALLPVSVCTSWDSSGCGTDAGAAGSSGSGAGSDAGAPPSGQSGGSVPGGSVPGGSVPYDPGQDQPSQGDTSGSSGSVYVETSCWGNSTTSDTSGANSCGGDSSSSSDGNTACGGDSSSSSSDGSSACGGDSSSSGESSACGGDSSSSDSGSCSGSSSSGDQSACSGSSSSSGSGSSGCSGGGSSSGSSNCSISSRGRRGGKLPMSALSVLIGALVWPLRRHRRALERRPD